MSDREMGDLSISGVLKTTNDDHAGELASLRTKLAKAERERDEAIAEEARKRRKLHEDAWAEARKFLARAKAAEARVKALEEALVWYGEQARLARLIHSEGDKGRHALADDGGRRARATLEEPT
jgi:signal transduction histidine kinase